MATFVYLSDADVERLLSVEACVDVQRQVFKALGSGEAINPHVQSMKTAGGVTLVKSACVPGHGVGSKVVSVCPPNAQLQPPQATVQASVLLVDEQTGALRALVQATALTAMRTAAGSVVATEALGNWSGSVLTVFGAGLQAQWHVRMLVHMRPVIRTVHVVNRSAKKAEELAETLEKELNTNGRSVSVDASTDTEQAVRQADIIVTATNAIEPLFQAEWVKPGCHINAVGSFQPHMCELPPELLKSARVVVDTEDAIDEAGEIINAMKAGHLHRSVITSLGQVLLADTDPDPTAITIFKSVGVAAQDIATAHLAAKAAGH
eukprot:comp19647_c0_seq1/m.23234 comp19647_c0_seq1/g.23234  ORF comp19647_c0_seq1/g.23234 comp19647_c0_seq1/m.23234 type:complete len:321 (-) comp19647_c0_seq1:631-1593(-)